MRVMNKLGRGRPALLLRDYWIGKQRACAMGTKMKGICKSFKYISQIFVVKEREMEIGYPTDVKHVAHIGWDGQSTYAPSWMNEFKTTSDFPVSSLSDLGDRSKCFPVSSPWSSQDFEQSMAQQPSSEILRDSPPRDLPKVPKKHKRTKKSKSLSSSPISSSSSSLKTTRTSKSKAVIVNTINEDGKQIYEE
ncbi:hypothetical protein Sjap_025286 [Stephania japonica]|uniref:CRIB domain-containing protein n=1 Tax=Stephania japonica TaxID=461633 RepID=A0AAP0E424_9MAGN